MTSHLSQAVPNSIPGGSLFGAVVEYTRIHDQAVESWNRDPNSDETERLRTSERAARNVLLREMLVVGRAALQGS